VEARQDQVSSQTAAVWMLVVAAAVLPTELGAGHGASNDVVVALGAVLAAAASSAVVLVGRPQVGVVLAAAALCTAGAAAIHFSVTSEHFREWWGFGLFFLCAAWAQLVWAAVVVRVESQTLLLVGLVGNLAVVLLWLVTRTVGLPFGPDPGEIETLGWADGVTSSLELVAALCCAGALARPTALRRVGVPVAAVALLVTAVTAVGIASAVGAHAH